MSQKRIRLNGTLAEDMLCAVTFAAQIHIIYTLC